jgi:hypothetical protein
MHNSADDIHYKAVFYEEVIFANRTLANRREIIRD